MGEDGRGGEDDDDEDVRRVWVWVHPAAARGALREVRRACALEGAPWQGSVQVYTCVSLYGLSASLFVGLPSGVLSGDHSGLLIVEGRYREGRREKAQPTPLRVGPRDSYSIRRNGSPVTIFPRDGYVCLRDAHFVTAA